MVFISHIQYQNGVSQNKNLEDHLPQKLGDGWILMKGHDSKIQLLNVQP